MLPSDSKGQGKTVSKSGSAPRLSVTAKRSPSILVTDARKSQIKAPFAGHRLEQIQKHKHDSRANMHQRTSGLVNSMRRSSSSKYSDISISNLTSNISDIPSSRQRDAPRYRTPDTYISNRIGPKVPQYMKTLPSRTSKVTQKLVLIPDGDLSNHDLLESRGKSTTDNIFQENYHRTRAEQMTKDQRENEYPRVTAYLIAEGFNLKLAAKFLAKNHLVLPRLYDEALYIPYSLPLLPGEKGYRVQSNTSLKMQHGNQLMEHFIDKSEERDHHYEFYSGADGENPHIETGENNDVDLLTDSPKSNLDFNPSEPQFFVSNSPTESILEEEIRESIKKEKEKEKEKEKKKEEAEDIGSNKKKVSENLSSLNNSNILFDEINSGTLRQTNTHRSGYSKKHSVLPDLSKHAEMFILDYGVVVFWNFTEIHEKNILADLVFAKIQPGEFDLDDDDDEDEDSDDSPTGNNMNNPFSDDDDEEDDEEQEGDISLIIKPVPEHDIETEEFHFEYNKDVHTPRIYNDMITLKSGDHLIKLTISHAIAQSTKLSLFESKMSNILNSISKLPKALALTGKLQNYTTKRLLIKTGRLFQLRSEVNLLSNVLDTPEYFWSIEPALHPLYTAIRDYLEIEQRVEVINDRCKVFLDFFDILSDSLAERKMTKITKILIIAIGLSVVVSMLEILVRYLIISRL